MAFTCLVHTQEYSESRTVEKTAGIGRNELKVNLVYTLLEVPEVTYERILGPDSGIGVSVDLAVNDDIGYRFAIIPHYRFYFGKAYGGGFFLELNSLIGSIRDEPLIDFGGEEESAQFAFGLGAATGVKFLTRTAWVAEIALGFGRYLASEQGMDYGYPRVGITLGRRF
ncbi:hypothetical protein RB2501_03330 [Robiginitalea biformata HTCC2501]|uniref:Outer membrane protein beta-barrel domain-containing protein n=1 Tax=Robiginitalea biformata (strain ATCC BAA-864 / DSM 15991 / KCTC 12146 / HTCC2501) TaxID=313596 RepID=A4CG36_ROBBH|nr:hypothetical protein RB2501_03330 [Robiginitalea biformata HTCC2501]